MKIIEQELFAEPEAFSELADEPIVIHRRRNARSVNLIVFIHGLGGNRYGDGSTWGEFPRFVFDDFDGLDVGIYHYRTLFGRLKFWESVALADEARVLADILRAASETYDRIILAGHSMGGLLCQAALADLLRENQPAVVEHITGIILMATPQTGSQRVPWFLSFFSKDARALKPHGEFVTSIQEVLQSHLVMDERQEAQGKLVVPTWAVLGSSDMWVDRLTAGLGLGRDRKCTVRGSHTSIVKPKTKTQDAYVFARKCIATALSRPVGVKAAVGVIHIAVPSVEAPEWLGPVDLSFSVTNQSRSTMKLVALQLIVQQRQLLNDHRLPLPGAPIEEFELVADIRNGDAVDLLTQLNTQFIMQPGESEAFRLSITCADGFVHRCSLHCSVADVRTGAVHSLKPAPFSITAPIATLETLRARSAGGTNA